MPFQKSVVILLMLFQLFATLPASSQQLKIVDNVLMDVDLSRSAHRVKFENGSVSQIPVVLGTTLNFVSGVRILHGGTITARLNAEEGKRYTLLISLSTNPNIATKRQTFHVKLNGKKVLAVSDVDGGGGLLRSYFVNFTAEGPHTDFELLSDNSNTGPVVLHSLRVYNEIGSPLVGSRASKMVVGIVSPKSSGFEIDPDSLHSTISLIPTSPFLSGEVGLLYNFTIRTAQENRTEINRLADLIERTNVPVRFMFQFEGGGLPVNVSDGAGNTFMDLPYQQITFDPDNAISNPSLKAMLGDHYDLKYGLTVPNKTGQPALTYNHPRLNQLRKIRFGQTISAWHTAREQMSVRGTAGLLSPNLSTGDPTTYFANGVDDSEYARVNGKPRKDLMGDFNPFVVADALKEGVNLDPRDGLDLQERNWLHLNLARQQQRIVDWFFETLPPTPIRMVDGKPFFVNEALRRNVYTEPTASPVFPLSSLGDNHPGIELGYVVNGRSGSEISAIGPNLKWILKSRERGRIAAPNINCFHNSASDDLAAISALYSAGARFITLDKVDTVTIKQTLEKFAQTVENPTGIDFLPANMTTPNGPDIQGKYVRTINANPNVAGINAIILFPQPGNSARPVTVSIRDDAANSLDYVSTTSVPNVLPDGSWKLFLPSIFQTWPGHSYRISISLPNQGTAQFRIAQDGVIAMRALFDISFERARSWEIEEWQDATDILDSLHFIHAGAPQSFFAKDALQEADALLNSNRPEEAYVAAIRAEQLSLPSHYLLPVGLNRMKPYYFNITAPIAPVSATIAKYTAEVATVIVKSEIAQNITLNWGKMTTTANLSPGIPVEVTLERLKNTDTRKAPTVRRNRAFRKPDTKMPLPKFDGKPMGPPTPVFGPPAPKPKI